jgi:Family of unknown function (DUF6088)
MYRDCDIDQLGVIMASGSVAAAVAKRVKKSPDHFWRPEDFEGSTTAVRQALHRLVRDGELRRERHGLYWRGTKTLLGMSPPPKERLVKEIAKCPGVGPAGATAANLLGLSTQLPRIPVYAVPRRLPNEVPGVKIVSRPACWKRAEAKLSPAEVALLEVLHDWDGLVEVDRSEATSVVSKLVSSGALRSAALSKAATSEPKAVKSRLDSVLASCSQGVVQS